MRFAAAIVAGIALTLSAHADDWTGKTIQVKEDGLKLGRKLGGGLVRDGAALDKSKTYRVKSSDDTYLELEGGFIFRNEATVVADEKPFPKVKAKETDPIAAKGEWFGKKVLPRRSPATIRIGDWVDGKQEYWVPHNLLNCTVREDRDGFLRLHDMRREGWVAKEDMVTAEDAPAWWDKAVKQNPGDWYGWFMRGHGWYDKGEYDNAIKDHTEAIRLKPGSATAHNSRGRDFDGKKEYDEARADYTEALRLDPKFEMAHNNRGRSWTFRKEYDKAIADYTEALRLDPKLVLALKNRGDAWREKKEYDKAIADYTEAIRLDVNDGECFGSRGYVWQIRNDYDKAIADYTEAIRLDPKNVWNYSARAEAWRGKKEWNKAIEDNSEVIRLSPQNVDAYNDRAATWYLLKNYEKAIADLRLAIQIDPKDVLCKGNIARVYAKLKKYDDAVSGFEKALELEPLDWVHREYALFRASCPDAKYRDGKKAVELAKKAIEKAGKDVDWGYPSALAAAYAEVGDFELAISEQRKAIEMLKGGKNPDKDDLKKAEARLELYRAKKPYRDEE